VPEHNADLVILGGGSGGYACALRAAELGMSVVLVERDKLGGTCLHSGCIPTQALLPETNGNNSDVGLLLFVRQEQPPAKRTDAEQVEVVRRQSAAEHLHGIAEARQRESGEVLGGELAEDRLPVAVVHEPRRRQRDLDDAAILRVRVHVDDAILIGVGQTAQEQVVDEAEDRRVQADPEGEGEQREQREPRRLQELPDGEAKVCNHVTPSFPGSAAPRCAPELP